MQGIAYEVNRAFLLYSGALFLFLFSVMLQRSPRFFSQKEM
jgi:hypothetical protein